MRLLVTRPEPDNAETAAALEAAGHTFLLAPLSRIVFRPAPDIAFRPAALLFTSRNGVRAAAAWPVTADWRDIPVFAVGEATAGAARGAGFVTVTAGGGDSVALAATVAAALDPLAGRLLHIAGRDRAGDLGAAVAARGFETVVAEAYAAEAATALPDDAAAAFREGTIDGVLFFSERAAATFRRLVKAAGLAERLAGVAAYALSERSAEPLRPLPFGRLRVAARPDQASLLALIGR